MMTIHFNPWAVARRATVTGIIVAGGYVIITQSKAVTIAKGNLKLTQAAWDKTFAEKGEEKKLKRKFQLTVSQRELEIAQLNNVIAQTKHDLKNAQTHLDILIAKQPPSADP